MTATHWLHCRHVCNWVREYRMPCTVLKEMPDGRLKVVVFGDRFWAGRQDKSRVRYVSAGRVTEKSQDD